MSLEHPSASLFLLWLVSLLATVGLGAATLLGIKVRESYCRFVVKGVTLLGLVFCLFSLFLEVLPSGLDPARVVIPWMRTSLLSMDVVLTADLYGWTYLAVAHVVLGAIGRFSSVYLENTSGYQKFMVLLLALQWGVISVITSDRFELLMMGWEVVGLGSVLLIGFIQDNRFSGSGSLTAFTSYKIGDIGLLVAGVMMHHLSPSGVISEIHHIPSEAPMLFVFGIAIICGSLAKGSQFPFVTWLPRAMEGPTPSSAAFYGALSVHLGPMLLIKLKDVWSWSPHLSLFIGIVGALTILYGVSVGRTVANYKVQLAYAIMVQIGLIFIEIACGWYSLAMLHICGHAGMRTAQFLRSGSLLGDFAENPAFLALNRRGQPARWMAYLQSKYLSLFASQSYIPDHARGSRGLQVAPMAIPVESGILRRFQVLAWNEFMMHRLGAALLRTFSVKLSYQSHQVFTPKLLFPGVLLMITCAGLWQGPPAYHMTVLLGLGCLASLLSFEAPLLLQRLGFVGLAHGVLLMICHSMGILAQSRLLVVNGFLTGLMVVAALAIVRDVESLAGVRLRAQKIHGLGLSFPHHGTALLALMILLGIAPGSLLFMMEDVVLERILSYGIFPFILVLILPVLLSTSLYRSYTEFFMGFDRRWINPAAVKPNVVVYGATFLVVVSIVLSIFPQGLW